MSKRTKVQSSKNSTALSKRRAIKNVQAKIEASALEPLSAVASIAEKLPATGLDVVFPPPSKNIELGETPANLKGRA